MSVSDDVCASNASTIECSVDPTCKRREAHIDGIEGCLVRIDDDNVFSCSTQCRRQTCHAAFTADDTGTEKPDPAFFHKVFDFVSGEGASKDDILHVAQSQYHDIGVSRALGMTNCWIERRHAQKGYGGTIEPAEFTRPDYHFTSMAGLAEAVATART